MNITKAWLITGSRMFGDRVVVADHEADRVIYDRNDGSVKIALVPQPIYDEAKELEKFSIQWKLEGRIYRDKNTHQWLPTRDSIEGFQMAERVHALWLGWESCAQSRAKAGEDE